MSSPLVRQLGQLDNIAAQWALQDQLLLHMMLKGLFALVLSENPRRTPWRFRQQLKDTTFTQAHM
jgi:hypothetical protein